MPLAVLLCTFWLRWSRLDSPLIARHALESFSFLSWHYSVASSPCVPHVSTQNSLWKKSLGADVTPNGYSHTPTPQCISEDVRFDCFGYGRVVAMESFHCWSYTLRHSSNGVCMAVATLTFHYEELPVRATFIFTPASTSLDTPDPHQHHHNYPMMVNFPIKQKHYFANQLTNSRQIDDVANQWIVTM